LAIHGSATPAKWGLSNGSQTGTKLQNSLSLDLFEALPLLKSTYHNHHISANTIIVKDIDALIEELDTEEDEMSNYLQNIFVTHHILSDEGGKKCPLQHPNTSEHQTEHIEPEHRVQVQGSACA
jgi:hypothetical protein